MRRAVTTTDLPTDVVGSVTVYVPSVRVFAPTPSPRLGMTTLAPGIPFPAASVTRPLITACACALDAVANDAARTREATNSRLNCLMVLMLYLKFREVARRHPAGGVIHDPLPFDACLRRGLMRGSLFSRVSSYGTSLKRFCESDPHRGRRWPQTTRTEQGGVLAFSSTARDERPVQLSDSCCVALQSPR
jgi:hypothetical protein